MELTQQVQLLSDCASTGARLAKKKRGGLRKSRHTRTNFMHFVMDERLKENGYLCGTPHFNSALIIIFMGRFAGRAMLNGRSDL